MTYAEAMALTRRVSKMESKTKTRVMAETKATPLTEPSVVSQTKSKAMPMSRLSAVTHYKVKAGAGREANIGSKDNIGSRSQRRSKASIKLKAGDRAGTVTQFSDEDGKNVCS